MYTIDCPFCKKEFEPVELWDHGECPHCKEEYWWDEWCTEDYTDCWPYIKWKNS